jgi:hypothetical protein
MALSEVDAFQRFLDLLQGRLERVIASDNRLAVAVRSSDSTQAVAWQANYDPFGRAAVV